jgi:hypothetical protein
MSTTNKYLFPFILVTCLFFVWAFLHNINPIVINNGFTFENKATADAENPKMQKWEKLMWKYQLALRAVRPGERRIWIKNIFSLNDTGN